MHREVIFVKAVMITFDAQAKKWTFVNVVKLEDRDIKPVRFEAITGNVITKKDVEDVE